MAHSCGRRPEQGDSQHAGRGARGKTRLDEPGAKGLQGDGGAESQDSEDRGKQKKRTLSLFQKIRTVGS